jgi:Xaa-Pro aminopeptidase
MITIDGGAPRARTRSAQRPAAAALVLTLLLLPELAPAQVGPAARRADVAAVQGILAVQRLDGWLLTDQAGDNPLARRVVVPAGHPVQRWFYYVPARGTPTLLVHASERGLFAGLPGNTLEYTGYRELEAGLGQMLRGARQVAMEYAPESRIPALTRVDAATVQLVRRRRVKVRSSAELVQFALSLWGPAGRIAHHVAVHHLSRLRDEALAFIAQRVRGGQGVSEYEVQQLILRGYRMRGIVGPPPVVAAAARSADPAYRPTAELSHDIARGDLLRLSLAARVEQGARPIYAELRWMAYVGEQVPERLVALFDAVVAARDAAIELLRERVRRRRPPRGHELDQRARQVISTAGHAAGILHPTGHSLDEELLGAGANLDDTEVRDTRPLVIGSGFTVSPCIYLRGQVGLCAGGNVYIGPGDIEVTTPLQQHISPIPAPRPGGS